MSDPKRTEFAMKALDLADLFRMFCGDTCVHGGNLIYQPELSAPEGMSTGGGKQAVQAIKLVPSGGGTTIVAGSCNQVEMTAEVRTYNHLAALHAQRFRGAKLPIDAAEYGELVTKIQTFFSDRGIRVTVVDSAPVAAVGGAAAAPARAAGGSQLGMIIAVVVVTALVVGGAMFFVLRNAGGG